MPNSSTPQKVPKPRPDFPLYCHASNRWAKKIRGKLHYFGKASTDPKGKKALGLWLDQKDELLSGRTPRRAGTTTGPTVEDICNEFFAHKDELRKTGEITERTYEQYLATGKRLAKAFGHKTPVDDLVADDFRHLRAGIAKRGAQRDTNRPRQSALRTRALANDILPESSP